MFMYLHLEIVDGKLHASVKNQGSLKFSSLGGPNSQITYLPVAVLKIDEFTGLEAISGEDLWNELFRRETTEGLMHRFGIELTTEELLTQLKQQLR